MNEFSHHPLGSNCLDCLLPHAVTLPCCRLFGGLANFPRAAACAVVAVSGSISTSGWGTLVVSFQSRLVQPSRLAWRGKNHFLSVDCVSARGTPGSSNPVPTASDSRGDESNCGGGAGCEKTISILSHSTVTLILSVWSSGVWGHLGLYSFEERGSELKRTYFGYDLDSVETCLSLPRAPADVAFALVCAIRQAPSLICVHAGANMLPLILISFYEYHVPC